MNGDAYTRIVGGLSNCQTQKEFDNLLSQFLLKCRDSNDPIEAICGIEFLSEEKVINARLTTFCRFYFKDFKTTGFDSFKHLVFIGLLSRIPENTRRYPEAKRAWILEWLFRFLSDRDYQWILFDIYADNISQMHSDFWFMEQAREWLKNGIEWGDEAV